jgi:hypothetical protein
MANGISVIAGISTNLGIAGSDTGLSIGTGITGNNPDSTAGGQRILTDAGVQLQTDAGVDLHTSD